MSSQRLARWVPLLPLLLAFSFNFNVLGNDFGWDDESVILNISSPEHWSDLFLPQPPRAVSFDTTSSYYRPLIAVSYLIDHKLWGKTPSGFHLSVWLAHLLNTVLVFFLAKALVRTQVKAEGKNKVETEAEGKRSADHFLNLNLSLILIPLFASSLFAVHPIHAEAVAWIAGRNDVFCTTFLLTSFLFYIRFHQTQNWAVYGLSMACFLLALLTKEIAVGLILVFIIYEYLSDDKKLTRILNRIAIRSAVPLAILGAYIWVRNLKLARPYGESTLQGLVSHSSGSELSEMVVATGMYLQMMLFPFPHHPFIATLPESSQAILGSVLLSVLIMGLWVWALVYRKVTLGMALAWMFILLGPAILVSVLDVAVTPAAERYTYAPTVGFVIALSWVILKGIERLHGVAGRRKGLMRLATGFIGIVLVIGLGSTSWGRNTVWLNKASFWKLAMASVPDAGLPHRQVGTLYGRIRNYSMAEKHYRLSILKDEAAFGPEYSDLSKSFYALAVLYVKQGRFDEAEPLYQRSLVIEESAVGPNHPGLAVILHRLAELYQSQNRYAEAEPLYRRSLAIREGAFGLNHRNVAECLQSIGEIKDALGEYDLAESFYRRSLAIRERVLGMDHKSAAHSLSRLAELLHQQGRYAKAELFYQRALVIQEGFAWTGNPYEARTHFKLGELYHAQSQFGKAETHYRKSTTMREKTFGPEHPVLVKNLERHAALLRKMDREAEAVEMDRRARNIREGKIQRGIGRP